MARRKPAKRVSPDEALFGARRTTPFAFVLDELEELAPYTRPMFGCTAVYVGDKIVFILRDRPTARDDNGVWVATTREHHASLRRELAGLRTIGVLADGGETGWQNLPADDDDFEESAMRACALVRADDPRIGKVPKSKASRKGGPSHEPVREGPRKKPPPAKGPPRKGPPLGKPPSKGPPQRPPPKRTAR